MSQDFSRALHEDEPTMVMVGGSRQDMTSAKFYTFMLMAYAVAVLVRMPDILIKRRFWAEEGELYFHNAWNERWYDALFAVHSGYLTRIIHEVGEAGFLRRLGGAVFGGVGDAAIGV